MRNFNLNKCLISISIALLFSFYSYGQNCEDLLVFTDFSGEIEDGSGDQYYDEFLECEYLIQVEEGEQIIANFKNLDIAFNDSIIFYDGPSENDNVLAYVRTSNYFGNFVSSSNQMYIRFLTDSMKNHQGWSIEYSTLEDTIKDVSIVLNNLEYDDQDELQMDFTLSYNELENDSIMLVFSYLKSNYYMPFDTLYYELDSTGELSKEVSFNHFESMLPFGSPWYRIEAIIPNHLEFNIENNLSNVKSDYYSFCSTIEDSLNCFDTLSIFKDIVTYHHIDLNCFTNFQPVDQSNRHQVFEIYIDSITRELNLIINSKESELADNYESYLNIEIPHLGFQKDTIIEIITPTPYAQVEILQNSDRRIDIEILSSCIDEQLEDLYILYGFILSGTDEIVIKTLLNTTHYDHQTDYTITAVDKISGAEYVLKSDSILVKVEMPTEFIDTLDYETFDLPFGNYDLYFTINSSNLIEEYNLTNNRKLIGDFGFSSCSGIFNSNECEGEIYIEEGSVIANSDCRWVVQSDDAKQYGIILKDLKYSHIIVLRNLNTSLIDQFITTSKIGDTLYSTDAGFTLDFEPSIDSLYFNVEYFCLDEYFDDLEPQLIVNTSPLDTDFEINYRVKNSVSRKFENVRLALYLSTDQTLNVNEDYLFYETVIDSSNENGYISEHVSFDYFDFNSIPDGDYYVGVNIDLDDEIDEYNEENNMLINKSEHITLNNCTPFYQTGNCLGELSSGNTPGLTLNYMTCLQHLEVPLNEGISLDFTSFSLPDYSTVTIYDGEFLTDEVLISLDDNTMDWEIPDDLKSSSSKILIKTSTLYHAFFDSYHWNLNYQCDIDEPNLTVIQNQELSQIDNQIESNVKLINDSPIASESFDLSYFLSEDLEWSDDDVEINVEFINNIGAGEYMDFDFSINLDEHNELIQDGFVYLVVVADSDLEISEPNENDNVHIFSSPLNNIPSINVELNRSLIQMHPNPAQDLIYISKLSENAKKLEIFDLNGNLIENVLLGSDKITISLETFIQGIYFVQIKNDKNEIIYISKLVKI